jgi:hypothetical protein
LRWIRNYKSVASHVLIVKALSLPVFKLRNVASATGLPKVCVIIFIPFARYCPHYWSHLSFANMYIVKGDPAITSAEMVVADIN